MSEAQKTREVGELDSRIKIRAPLRCDGIGRLDCAEDVESGARMAVRWLPLEANGDVAARAIAELPAHPTLPKIRQTGRVGASAYVAMDFPDGRLLSTMLGEPMPVESLCRMGAEIADALAKVHAQGTFHGEMSADSLLLVPQGKAILWDMPLVVANRLTDRRGEERVMSQLVRMAPFLSPERAQGMPPSPASDVYALGAILCLAGGGRSPSGATTLAVVHQIATGQWAPEVPQSFPPALRQVVEQMIHRDPLQRPSAAEAAELLSKPMATPTIPELPTVLVDPEIPAETIAPAAKRTLRERFLGTLRQKDELLPKRNPLMLLGATGLLSMLAISGVAYLAVRSVPSPAGAEPASVEPNPAAAEAMESSKAEGSGVVAPVPAEAMQEVLRPKLPSDEDLLAPLEPVTRRYLKAGATAEVEAKVKPRPEPAPAAEAPGPTDFSFLEGEKEAEKPTEELKRPSF